MEEKATSQESFIHIKKMAKGTHWEVKVYSNETKEEIDRLRKLATEQYNLLKGETWEL